MLLPVILRHEMKKLGKVGDVVEVKRGYARYLMRYEYAMRATATNISRIAEQRAVLEQAARQRQEAVLELLHAAHGKVAMVICQASEDGRLFGSVKPRDILTAFAAQGITLAKEHIIIRTPIKTIGVHRIPFSAHMEHACFFYVNVARTPDEAKASEEAFFNPDKKAKAASAQDEPELQRNASKQDREHHREHASEGADEDSSTDAL